MLAIHMQIKIFLMSKHVDTVLLFEVMLLNNKFILGHFAKCHQILANSSTLWRGMEHMDTNKTRKT